MSKIKPSLEATADLSPEDETASGGLFGKQQFLDYGKFSKLCFEHRLALLKPALLGCNEGKFEQEIAALKTLEDLQAFVRRSDVECTGNAVRAAAQGGRLYRIDNVSAVEGSSLTLNWGAVGQGFGQLSFFVGEDGKLHVDSECMGPHFIRSVLMRLVDELVID